MQTIGMTFNEWLIRTKRYFSDAEYVIARNAFQAGQDSIRPGQWVDSSKRTPPQSLRNVLACRHDGHVEKVRAVEVKYYKMWPWWYEPETVPPPPIERNQ